ncbi:MAG: class I SAM-dependent methyltransferase [Actinobacteria bacterium]|nr:MAG: class I SAM-dependent methyltransferase [Actinomycetota bacterium]
MTTRTKHVVEVAPLTPPPDAFSFGRNWQRFVSRHLTPERERFAQESLGHLLGDIRNKSFVDIGCGSGLFSLSACRAGAQQIISVDVDPVAVGVTRELHAAAGSPRHWRILHGSILDYQLVRDLGTSDIVYSWGVLHHTGDMYSAIRNSAELVAPGGRLAIAIYNNVSDGWLTSARWWQIKRAYNRAPLQLQAVAGLTYAFSTELTDSLYWLLAKIRRREDAVIDARAQRRARGMARWTNVVDWLGGYPYEFATVEEIVGFCESSCDLTCNRVIPVPAGGTGNNEFVFMRATH